MYEQKLKHYWRAPTPASEEMSAFLWDWSTPSSSSCPPLGPPATTPPKNWALSLPRPKKRQESSKGWGSGTFAGLLFSNLVSLLLGAGLGVWIYRRYSLESLFVFYQDNKSMTKCQSNCCPLLDWLSVLLLFDGMCVQINATCPCVTISLRLLCKEIKQASKFFFSRTTRTIEVVMIWP